MQGSAVESRVPAPLTDDASVVAAAPPWPAMRSAAIPIEIQIVVLALCLRLFSAAVGFLGNITIPDFQDQGIVVLEQPNLFWDRFARWDAGWYYGIASNGYRFVEGGRSNLAFFPVYPQLMGILGRAMGGAREDFYFAGILISWLSFSVALVFLYRLARLDLPADASVRAVVYAAVFPSAYFFGAVYTESLFLLTLAGAALAFRTRHWMWAAVAAAVMTATRVNGVMFLPALALIGWDAAGGTWRDRRRALAAAVAGGVGIGAYSVFTYTLTGSAVEWYDSITRWGYQPGGHPLASLFAIFEALATRPYHFLTTEAMAPYDTLNAMSASAALAAIPFIWMAFGRGYAAIVVMGLLLPLSSGKYEGLGRYCSVLFPLPFLLGSLKGETRHLAVIIGFVMFYSLGLVLFGNVHPLF